jgi:hypothetical protein
MRWERCCEPLYHEGVEGGATLVRTAIKMILAAPAASIARAASATLPKSVLEGSMQ